ncbi:hypothetical protein VSAK1_13726 [Vibrio mediterranei AK1]|uniref:hypothetical protein n=1 Tax=Vibrio mediterranei TaxID=689 RepID=UPI000154235C|nr:hypothetical protein [Vibrio mediterranei]EDL52610.1 hypothetical protein VSAK1_13726 [Vibrio mediterranei AK1]
MDINVGVSYWDSDCNEFYSNDQDFVLPEHHTFNEPPFSRTGFKRVLIDDKWHQVPTVKAYAKDRGQLDYWTHELDIIPSTHTLKEPSEYESWNVELDDWEYNPELHRPDKEQQEIAWRDIELTNVINRIEQYEGDQSYPVELRTSPIKSEDEFMQLLQDRKLLSDYPETPDFPFGDRPTLSGLAT